MVQVIWVPHNAQTQRRLGAAQRTDINPDPERVPCSSDRYGKRPPKAPRAKAASVEGAPQSRGVVRNITPRRLDGGGVRE